METKTIDRKTACSLFQIQSVRWKNREIGIADYRISNHNEIHILQKGKNGRYFPDTYYISGEDARKYPSENVGHSVEVRLIPIKDLKILERTE